MGRLKLKLDPQDVDIKVFHASRNFRSGWSLSASMSKAGFPANWMTHLIIREHPRIIQMREENIQRNYEKRMFKLKV